MSERRIIVDGTTLRYEGIFNFNELYLLIENWVRQKGYDQNELKNFEQMLKDGRDIEIEMYPYKKTTDYHKLIIKIVIIAKKMKDVVLKKDGIDVKMNDGQLQIKFTGYLVTDYDNKWEGKPLYWFLRLLFDKFIYRAETTRQTRIITDEIDSLYNYLRSYLNMARK
ncbi:hypothetical protein JXB31_04125 [Candidatus Woesearchaeota archaeon]|nr:hypothetical protein [Candidatus Woesearchaeota archaeon]